MLHNLPFLTRLNPGDRKIRLPYRLHKKTPLSGLMQILPFINLLISIRLAR